MATTYPPNTGTLLGPGRTNSGLSTQIIIKVDGNPVGALQTLTVDQARSVHRVTEIGTDGVIEIVPNKAAEYSLIAHRIVFDQLRLPEAFSRGFRFIGAQRLAFDIDIYDVASVNTPGGPIGSTGSIIMTYKNCWFTQMSTPYATGDYLITETSKIEAETAYISAGVSQGKPGGGAAYGTTPVLPQDKDIESSVNNGGRRGSMDASGLWYSLFGNDG
jgi:hypothetical protein